MLIDLAQTGRVVGVNNRPALRLAAIEIGIVEQIGIKKDHLAGAQRHRHRLTLIYIGRVDLKTAPRFERQTGLAEMAAGDDLETTVSRIGVVQIDKTGD